MKNLDKVMLFIASSLTLLLMLLGLASCTNPSPTLPTAASVVFAASPTIVASSTPIPASPTSTVALTPAPTPTRMPRSTSTSRPTKTPAPTVYPTLDAQDRLNFVLRAMKTNMGCELPCWWGITPGKTTWAEMIDTFVKQGIGFSERGRLSLTTHDPNNPRQSLDVILDVAFQEETGVINEIDIDVESWHWLTKPEYPAVLESYSLQTALTKHGVPTNVYLNLDIKRGVWDYALWLTYDTEGIVMGYRGALIRDNQGWSVCPTSSNTYGIAVGLHSPEVHTLPVDLTLGKNDYGFSGTLSDLTKISPEQFYSMYTQNPPPSCLLVSDPDP